MLDRAYEVWAKIIIFIGGGGIVSAVSENANAITGLCGFVLIVVQISTALVLRKKYRFEIEVMKAELMRRENDAGEG